MRKFLVIVIALATLSRLTSVASAGTVQIGGAHSVGEIKSTCEGAGGTFTQNGTLYGVLEQLWQRNGHLTFTAGSLGG